jgi:protoheme IX farnesyltransferase
VLLLPASILIYFTGAVSWIYLVVAILLGGFYIYLAFQGFYTKDDQEWSRKMFVYSLIYLTGILVTMILDAAIRGWIQ